ncbi:hypothetical protein MUK42_03487 [Musa troglodytarum]|uniref:Uncharacterized protein n=1 Tax=Musa troglodytarum TaxID=320322 RepID=A0A9E7HRG5_9LILI|nr:hypothetical protein MUK42_03487 [Musa troglodytarum]
MSKPHILLLDEPTNHLDMQSIDALADALQEFTGGVVLVSHDARLISRVCEDEEKSEIWVVEEGTVRKFPGSFEEYKEDLLKEIKAEMLLEMARMALDLMMHMVEVGMLATHNL